ncbi:MAG: phage holin family protein [Bradymonadaceae bacterium]|nr:phage holin family protein [Lujinxingiaceae bacterium]
MLKIILALIINGAAIWAAAQIVVGVQLTSDLVGIFIVALIFAVINTVLRPIANVLSFPFIILTLGLFILVINAALLALTAWLTPYLSVTGFVPALLGALVVSIVSWVLGIFLGAKR